jgi:hypothetical protein
VPLADVRILILGKNSDGSPLVAADVSHEVGISSPLWAVLVTGASVLIAFALLTIICYRRLRPLGLGDLDPFIRIITTPNGYASLSRLQMVVWTFVVAASAVYVMALSGDLIEVTTGTLVLLGISGAVTSGAAAGERADRKVSGRWVDRRCAQAALVRPHRQRRQRPARDRHRAGANALLHTRHGAFVVMRVLTSYVIPKSRRDFRS